MFLFWTWPFFGLQFNCFIYFWLLWLGFESALWMDLFCAVTHSFSSFLSSDESRPPQKAAGGPESPDIHMYDDSEEDDNEIGNADPVQDDLYARKLGMTGQPPAFVHFDTFLPKFWTPEEDVHVKKIRLGSQRRPWYREMQGFRSVQLQRKIQPTLYLY